MMAGFRVSSLTPLSLSSTAMASISSTKRLSALQSLTPQHLCLPAGQSFIDISSFARCRRCVPLLLSGHSLWLLRLERRNGSAYLGLRSVRLESAPLKILLLELLLFLLLPVQPFTLGFSSSLMNLRCHLFCHRGTPFDALFDFDL